MSDRPDAHDDSRLTALERRLEKASPTAGPPGLRRRVLSAIDDVLREDVQTTRVGSARHPVRPVSPDAMAGAALVSAVAAAVAAVVVSVAAVSKPVAPLSLDARARIAGVSDAPLGPLVAERQRANPALRSSQAHGPLAHPGMLRVLDAHHLLEETL